MTDFGMKDLFLHIEYVNGSEERFSLEDKSVVRDYSSSGASVRSVRVLGREDSEKRFSQYSKDRLTMVHQTTKS